MQSDDPPFLTLGTEVSAKFKGGWCEAKVKKVSKCVKCKVLLKEAPFGSVTLDDTNIISGKLEPNQPVEVLLPKQSSKVKGQVQYVKDHSTYTVLFNDGDERVLRRTQVCLKGGKHFDSAANLDTMPLYNPETFISSLLGRKRRRSPSSQSEADPIEEAPSCSKPTPSTPLKGIASTRSATRAIAKVMKEEEPTPTPAPFSPGATVLIREFIHKQGGRIQLGIVVSEEEYPHQLKKGEVAVRSLQNGRYHTTKLEQLSLYDPLSMQKLMDTAGGSLRVAFERANVYHSKGELPASWSKGRSRSSSSSSSSSSSPDERRDRFVAHFYKFQDESGSAINMAPTLGGKEIDLYKFYDYVNNKMGGHRRVTQEAKWSKVGRKLKVDVPAQSVKSTYMRYFEKFEAFMRHLGYSSLLESGGPSTSRSSRPIRTPALTAKKKSNRSTSKDSSMEPPVSSGGEDDTGERARRLKSPSGHQAVEDVGYTNAHIFTRFYQGQKIHARHHLRFYDARVITVKQPSLQEIAKALVDAFELSKITHHSPSREVNTLSASNMGVELKDALKNMVNATKCFVHYLGWNSRYDEWLMLHKIRVDEKDERSSATALEALIPSQLPPQLMAVAMDWCCSSEGIPSLAHTHAYTSDQQRPRRLSSSLLQQLKGEDTEGGTQLKFTIPHLNREEPVTYYSSKEGQGVIQGVYSAPPLPPKETGVEASLTGSSSVVAATVECLWPAKSEGRVEETIQLGGESNEEELSASSGAEDEPPLHAATTTAVRQRLIQRMEADNLFSSYSFIGLPDMGDVPELKAMEERMRELKDIYHQYRSKLTRLERRHKKCLQKSLHKRSH